MNLKRINTENKSDTKKFINFPYTLYKDNKYWVPPFFSEMKAILNRNKHPFYKHSTAEFFIVEEGVDVLGRIAILKNNNFCKHHDKQVAFFYYFDCINDDNVSKKLFDAAAAWSKNNGVKEIYGPRGFTRSSGIGMLIEGHQYYPAIGIPYNFNYYGDLTEKY